VLWDLKRVVEFPPGSTIHMPSAAIEHSNVPIQTHEDRCSFTQYSAGGLFRWVDHGFQKETKYKATISPENFQEEQVRMEAQRKLGLSLFSSFDELIA
jgi:hypothetical protein